MKKRISKGIIACLLSVTMIGVNSYHKMTPIKAAGDVVIDDTTFPDANFQTYVKSSAVDKNSDGVLSEEEIKAMTNMNINNKNIQNLKGIEIFEKLKYLAANENKLTTVDLSKNTELLTVKLDKNQLTNLDLSNHTKLTLVTANSNALTSFNVSGCTELNEIQVNFNFLSSIDVSTNLKLVYLVVRDNLLTSLDTSNNLALIDLTIPNNVLTTLDVSANENLTYLTASNFYDGNSDNQLEEIILGNKPKLKTLQVDSVDLERVDVSQAPLLETLYARYNKLETLDLSLNTKLKYLYLDGNAIASLDLSSNTLLSSNSLGTQKIAKGELTRKGNKWNIDFDDLLSAGEAANIKSVDNANSYDAISHIASYDVLPTSNVVKYTYDTKKFDMKVEATVTTNAKYNITFDGNGSKQDQSLKNLAIEASENDVVRDFSDFPSDPVRNGFAFRGWYFVDDNGAEVFVNSALEMPDYDIVLKAKWIVGEKEIVDTPTRVKIVGNDYILSLEQAKELLAMNVNEQWKQAIVYGKVTSFNMDLGNEEPITKVDLSKLEAKVGEYEVTYEGNGKLTLKVKVQNTKNIVSSPDTKDRSNIEYYLLLVVISMLGMALYHKMKKGNC